MDNEEQPVNRLDLFFIIQQFNRNEIDYDTFIRLSREWAEAMLQQNGATKQKPEVPD